MRLANRVLLCALAIFVLAAVASAQRSTNDPRNQSPSVGTGGPEGGPTGLFTIYDGDTLRRGEFTISIAYSDYARDPGDVDIVDVPISFNVGLTNRIELFFQTRAYRGIKVNSPLNLSSFSLPNSQVFFGSVLGSPPAIILSPSGPNVGTLAGTAVFRPPFCAGCVAVSPVPAGYFTFGQPFVQFPFTGGIGPNFGLSAGPPGGMFGFPGFSALLGPPTTNGNSFGAADRFPGVGSPVGSILPGVVLATRTLPGTALTAPIVVPTSFTVAPSYLPDAPFINRLYGQSSFTNLVFGAKIRLTNTRNPFGFGFIPFYRRWMDKADDASGFNQLQRGAGPGGNLGDFGLVMFLNGRLSRSVSLSANLGYILNSNPKNNGSTLLDRPDEVIAGVGFDFPVNKHFQPIAEFRSTQYVGGHTPNAFQNNPVEFLAGVKIYPRRWLGFGAWYRRQLNQQSQGHFNPLDATLPVNQVTGVNVPGRGIVIVPGTSVAVTSGGFPLGFRPSDNPQGFGAQVWFGHRQARAEAVLPNQPPVISSFAASTSTITLPCPPGTGSPTCPATANTSVTLTTSASDPDGDTLLYTYTVTGGRVTGEGASVTWDLSGVTPGTYTATVEVDDGCGCITSASTTVTVANCPDCVVPCPTVNVSCPDSVQQGSPATFTANVSGGPGTQTYSWTVSNGTITAGQGTSSITVDTTGKAGQSITASLTLGGLASACPSSFSCTTQVSQLPAACSKFDEYGNLRFNDEKARLDNFAIQLQNQPGAQGYYIIFGSCEGEADQRSARAVDYLVNTRGIDRGRITVVNGGCRETLTVELWICPSGAPAPTPSNTATVSPCPECKVKPKPRRRVRRRGEED